MKFTIMAGELADTVGWAAHALPKKTYAPVLNGLLIEADNGEIILSAFDYDTSRQASIDVDAAVTPGRILVPGRLLADVVKALPKGEIVDFSADDQEATIRCGRSEYVIPLMPVDDYPSLPKPPAPIGAVEPKLFAAAVAQTAVAAGNDPVVPMLNGVFLEVGDGLMHLAATDRYRITWRKFGWTPALDAAEVKALIPAKVLGDVVRGLPDEAVHICVGDGLAAFIAGSRTTTVRLIDEEFITIPSKFEAVEKNTPVTVTFDAGELAKVVKRVALMTSRSSSVRLSFTQDGVLVEAGDRSLAGLASEQADCLLDGDDIQVAFTVGYLLDMLGAFGGSVQMRAPKLQPFEAKAVVFRRGQDDDDYRHMLMPVRIAP